MLRLVLWAGRPTVKTCPNRPRAGPRGGSRKKTAYRPVTHTSCRPQSMWTMTARKSDTGGYAAHAHAGTAPWGANLFFWEDGQITQAAPLEVPDGHASAALRLRNTDTEPDGAEWINTLAELQLTVQTGHQHRDLTWPRTRPWVTGQPEDVRDLAHIVALSRTQRLDPYVAGEYTPPQAHRILIQAAWHLANSPERATSRHSAHWLLWRHTPSPVDAWGCCGDRLLHDPYTYVDSEGRLAVRRQNEPERM